MQHEPDSPGNLPPDLPSDPAPEERPSDSRPAHDADKVIDWIAAARSGSLEALGQLFAHCRGYLLTVAREEIDGDLRQKTRPSSVVQRTMITAQVCFGRFEGTSEGELLGWLRGIMMNHLSDLSKFFHRAKRHMGRELSLERDLEAAEHRELLRDEHMTPGHALVCDEEAQALVSAMARLPADYRDVIVLRNWNCVPWEEVGRRMQRSAEATRKLWTRAIDALRRELE
jgi:RNA polymerase sigma-70 factor (ECF subfamily)